MGGMMNKILVVDDNAAILEVVKMVLEMADCEVSTSLTGSCFHHLESPLPDLILLDVMLSGEDGSAICQELKSNKHLRHIPIILLSAQTGLPETAMRCGADGVLPTPFRLAALREIVNKHLSPARVGCSYFHRPSFLDAHS